MATWFADRCAQQGIPSVSLRRLLPEGSFLGCKDLRISGVSADSRRVEPGQVFVAIRGDRLDGHDYAARAVERGAAAVVVDSHRPEAGSPQVVVPDTRSALARIAQAMAGSPSIDLPTIGIAGSHGKTATGLLLRAILRAGTRPFGMIGPVEWLEGDDRLRAGPFTPGPIGLAEALAACSEQGRPGAVVGLSADAIRRRGTDGIRFRAVVVTRIEGDHPLDEARRRRADLGRLLRQLAPEGEGIAILDADDPSQAALAGSNPWADLITFGFDQTADVRGRILRSDRNGTELRVETPSGTFVASLALIGPDNARYALAATSAALAVGLPIDAIAAGLESVGKIPGRLEPIDRGQPFAVYLDRARTAPQLTRALTALREGIDRPARLHCLASADGGSSMLDRLALARAAEAMADRLVLTSGNTRGKDPVPLIDDLRAGLKRPSRAIAIADRCDAIAEILAAAAPGDAVLIAGLGRDLICPLGDSPIKDNDAALATAWLDHQGSRASRRIA
ncbi:MAG: Mur ligase family protein [Isosphaeraceae bacterium]